MARRKKSAEAAEAGDKSNGFDVEKTKPYVGRIENLQAQIDAINEEARKKAQPLREDIAAIKKEANEEDNIPRKELNTVVSFRRKIASAHNSLAKLSPDQKDTAERMLAVCDDLTGTPLDIAAQRKVA